MKMIAPDLVLAVPREAQSKEEAKALSSSERQAIIDTWHRVAVPEVIERRKGEHEACRCAREAGLLKTDLNSWPLHDSIIEQICTVGRQSFVAELREAERDAEAEVKAEVNAAGRGKAKADADSPTTASPSETTLVDPSSAKSAPTPNAPTIEVQSADTPTASTPGTQCSSAGTSMAELALAGTERWDWSSSRPGSRASMGI
jgi:hypothetical protein